MDVSHLVVTVQPLAGALALPRALSLSARVSSAASLSPNVAAEVRVLTICELVEEKDLSLKQ